MYSLAWRYNERGVRQACSFAVHCNGKEIGTFTGGVFYAATNHMGAIAYSLMKFLCDMYEDKNSIFWK